MNAPGDPDHSKRSTLPAWLRPPTALAIALILAGVVLALRLEGQPWWCRLGDLALWSGDIHSPHNSQHPFDPYSLTHLLHGIIFYALFRPLAVRMTPGARVVSALALEAAWEVVENSPPVIERYRRATIALGYSGDSVVNSLGDIASCGLGLYLAARLPARWSVALFVAVELFLLAFYRDNLTLNVLMLVWPVGAIKAWQAAG